MESNADKDCATEGMTPLYAAAFSGRFDVARFLVQARPFKSIKGRMKQVAGLKPEKQK